jgi:hypothetical protein
MLRCLIVFIIVALEIIFNLIAVSDVTHNPCPVLQPPSASDDTQDIINASSSAGFAVFAHVSDLHVGNTGFTTENASVLFDFIKTVIKPKRIFNTGDLTHAVTQGFFLSKLLHFAYRFS